MTSIPTGSGLTAKLNKKEDGNYSSELAKEAWSFIEHYVPEAHCNNFNSSGMHEALKDGVNLCKLINALNPRSVKKIKDNRMPSKEMENIGNFLEAAFKYGCNKEDMFQTVDLFDAQNMPQVINGIHALRRQAQKKEMAGIGPKEFTSEGKNIIGLQMGNQ